ncbi:Serine/threonine-protein kinase plk4 [Borealophlyctis nickersoniae]|nr:Serine/threonine-protein kinase plk4 [Borealophlyctis nickersoniae]
MLTRQLPADVMNAPTRSLRTPPGTRRRVGDGYGGNGEMQADSGPVNDYTFTSPRKTPKRFSDRIEDYELGELLGRGGFGFVHRATSKSKGTYGREVAIKLIDKRLMKAANMTRRVANEVEIHWQLRHKSILELYNYFEDDSYVYLVMELCKNGELYRYIQQQKSPLSEPEARGTATQLIEGMLYLHANGIIHRDLKLSNLLLTDKFDLKIADFGLAVKLSDPDGEQKTMCGTPNYISPEIVSRQPYGLASDVWSLGCMLVTIMTGTPPFESQAVKNTLDKVSRADYRLPESLSPEAKDLIHRLLQKDPKRRLPLGKVLSHPFFHPSLPVLPLRPLSPVFNSSQRRTPFEPVDLYNTNTNVGRGNGRPRSGQLFEDDEDENVPPSRSPTLPKTGGGTMRVRGNDGGGNGGHFSAHPRREGRANGGQRLDFGNVELGSRDARNDREGTQSKGKQAEHPRDSETRGEEAIDHSELPPFSTARLKPLKQKTKHGSVAILQDGRLFLDFVGEEYLITISGDSSQVYFYDRATDPTDISVRPLRTCPRNMLPKSYVKKFRYASRFIHLVRSKTPKIVFYSPQAKCLLMENGPLADFEMIFYNGIKVHNSVGRQMLEIKMPHYPASGGTEPQVHRIDMSHPESIQLPPSLTPIFKHVQECLRQCMDIERSGKLDTTTRYPLILKSSQTQVISSPAGRPASPPTSFHPSSMSTYTRSGPSANGTRVYGQRAPEGTKERGDGTRRDGGSASYGDVETGRPPSAPIPRAKSASGNTTPALLRQRTGGAASAPASVRGTGGKRSTWDQERFEDKSKGVPVSSSASVRSATQRGDPAPARSSAATDSFLNRVEGGGGGAGSGRVGGMVGSCTPSVVGAGAASTTSVSPGWPDMNCQFLPEVGWCLKGPDGRFVMLFTDGICVTVDARDQSLEWTAKGEETERYQIDKNLPDYVKAKLTHFPRFLKLAGVGSGHNGLGGMNGCASNASTNGI